MPQTTIEPGWRALAGFYAIGIESVETYNNYNNERDFKERPWSYSDSCLLAQDQINRWFWTLTATELVRVDSVHSFGFGMLETVDIGHRRFERTNGQLWIATRKVLEPTQTIIVTMKGCCEHLVVKEAVQS